MVDSLISTPDGSKGVRETLQLLNAVAVHNTQALLAGGGPELCTRLMKSSKRAEVLAVAAKALELMGKLPGGSEKIMAAGALDVSGHLSVSCVRGDARLQLTFGHLQQSMFMLF